MVTEPPNGPCTTPADTISAIQAGSSLSSVDLSLRTPSVCEAAVRHDARNIRDVPDTVITPELCALAVGENGLTLESIPECLKTTQLCFQAVLQCAHALRFVPESMRTADLVNVALSKWGRAITWVPEAMRTLELYEKAVAEDGSALEFVPLHLRTRKMCREAVAHKARRGAESGLEYAPAEEKNYWLCAMSVFYHPWSLQHVPPRLRCLEVCAIAVSKSSYVNNYVPFDMRDSPALLERIDTIKMIEQRIRELEEEVREAMQPGLTRARTWWDAQAHWEAIDRQQGNPIYAFAQPWLEKLNWLKREKDLDSYTWTKLRNWN